MDKIMEKIVALCKRRGFTFYAIKSKEGI